MNSILATSRSVDEVEVPLLELRRLVDACDAQVVVCVCDDVLVCIERFHLEPGLVLHDRVVELPNEEVNASELLLVVSELVVNGQLRQPRAELALENDAVRAAAGVGVVRGDHGYLACTIVVLGHLQNKVSFGRKQGVGADLDVEDIALVADDFAGGLKVHIELGRDEVLEVERRRGDLELVPFRRVQVGLDVEDLANRNWVYEVADAASQHQVLLRVEYDLGNLAGENSAVKRLAQVLNCARQPSGPILIRVADDGFLAPNGSGFSWNL